jgi:hypothetical protein
VNATETLFAEAADVLSDIAADEHANATGPVAKAELLGDICALLQAHGVVDLIEALAEIAAEGHSHATENNIDGGEALRKATVLLSDAAAALENEQ